MLYTLAECEGALWFPHPGLYAGVIQWGKWQYSPPMPLGQLRARVSRYGASRQVSVVAPLMEPGEVTTLQKSDPRKRGRSGQWESVQTWVKIKRVE